MKFNATIGTIAALAVLITGLPAHAVAVQETDQIDLVQSLQETDESTLQMASTAQSESFRSLPSQLREQGIEISSDQEQKFNQLADSLSADAKKPGLKARMIQELKKTNHILSRGALHSLQGLGYSGSVAFSLFLIPFEVPADFLSALVSGKPCFEDETPFSGDAAGYLGAGLGFYYSWVTVSIIGGASVIAPVIAGPLGAETIDQIVCSEKNKRTDLAQFCSNNSKLLKVMVGGSARASTDAGEFIHNLIARPVDKVITLFPHKKSHPKPIVTCTGVCSIWKGNGTDLLKNVDVTADSVYDLNVACSKAADFFSHPWSVQNTSCN